MRECKESIESQAYSFIYAMAYCAILKNDIPNALLAIKLLDEIREGFKNSTGPISSSLNAQEKQFRIDLITISVDELSALIAKQKGDLVLALKLLEQAVKIENAFPLPNGIPVPVQSALTLYGSLLLQDKQWEKAKEVYLQALDRMPMQAKSYVGLALAMEGLGDKDQAQSYAEQALKIWRDADTNFPELAEAKRLAGK